VVQHNNIALINLSNDPCLLISIQKLEIQEISNSVKRNAVEDILEKPGKYTFQKMNINKMKRLKNFSSPLKY